MTDLKPGWQRVKFGEVVRLNKETCKDPEAAGISRVIGLEHLEPSDLRVRSWADVADGTTFSNRVRPGQVLFGKRRAYQRKVAVADFDAICSGDIYVFESADPKRLLPELLPFICQTEVFFEYAVGTSAGSLSPRTNWKSLAAYEFALPPLEEQRRMCKFLAASIESVHALEELASAADIVAQAAVDTCVANCPSEPLGNTAAFVTSGSRGWAQHYAESGDLFLRVTNLQPNSIRLDLIDRKFVKPPEGAEGLRTLVRSGDVLVAVTGEYLGMIGLVTESIGRAYVNQHVAIVRLDQGLADPSFVAFSLTSSVAQQSVWSRNDGGTKPGMTLGQVRSLPIPAISVEEQRSWSKRFEQIEQQRDNSRARIKSARQMFHVFLNSELS